MQRPILRFAALAASTALAFTVVACDGDVASATASYAAATTRLNAGAAAQVSSRVAELQRASARRQMALDALLVNLLDDAEPPRFADVAQPLVCGDGSTVLVNGKPLEAGAELPVASFTLDFQLAGACPLGIAGPRLSGPVTMVVVRDDDAGLVPVVLGQH
jgi:hypothetical protein